MAGLIGRATAAVQAVSGGQSPACLLMPFDLIHHVSCSQQPPSHAANRPIHTCARVCKCVCMCVCNYIIHA